MMRTLAADVTAGAGAVVLQGWVHRIRELGAVNFVLLRDRSGMVQLVAGELPEGLSSECVVSAQGTVQVNPKAPGGLEVALSALEILAPAETDLPIPVNQSPDKLGVDTILDNRLLSLRNPGLRRVFEVQATLIAAFAEHLRGEDFTEIKTSKLIGTGTEGGTGLFRVDYFDTEVFLAQSPQFYKQAMVASGLERVFEVAPAYRAEKHDTPRHLNEYVSLDVEMGFISSEADLMDLEVRLLQSMLVAVRQRHPGIGERSGSVLPDPDRLKAIPRVDHTEAREIAARLGGKRVLEINPDAERVLCDWAAEEHGVPAVFVTGFPRRKRPFYTWPEGQSTRSFDLLYGGLEITTGGQRINRLDALDDSIQRFGLDLESLSDYRSIFRYGCPPHGGFAIGLERLTQKICGLESVKLASAFPRDRNRTRP